MTSSETYDVPDERMLDRSIAAADFIGPEVARPAADESARGGRRRRRRGGGDRGASRRARASATCCCSSGTGSPPGSSWHAAGLLARVRGSHALTELATYSLETYRTLEARTGLPVAFNQNGSLTLARQPGRVDELSPPPASRATTASTPRC